MKVATMSGRSGRKFGRAVFALLGAIIVITNLPLSSHASIKIQMMKPRAYFIEGNQGLLEALDLKTKTVRFDKKDIDQCGANLVRRAQTLTYSCTLPIPTNAGISRLQNLVTPSKRTVNFGSAKRDVITQVSSEARQITFTTGFDTTGIDFEVSKFNDDFFAVYAKAAQSMIAETMTKQPVRLEILENR
jgi:hypothetical protein